MSSAILPTPCRCGRIVAEIGDSAVMCECGATRSTISTTSHEVLTDIVRLFGEPAEPVVFRRPDAMAQVTKQDEFLKRKRRPDGKSWYDVITENLDENFLSDEATGIDPDPIGTERDQ